jgi:hypothetical protein
MRQLFRGSSAHSDNQLSNKLSYEKATNFNKQGTENDSFKRNRSNPVSFSAL